MTDQTVGSLGPTQVPQGQVEQGQVEAPLRDRRVTTVRHSAWVRVTHWVWVIALVVLFMSGLQIFNAHPNLNFGNTTTFDPATKGANRLVLDIDNDGYKGVTTVLGHRFDTTGVLGVSDGPDGPAARGFPSWMTIPGTQDLSTGRLWHVLFAWVLLIDSAVFIVYGLVSGHIGRDLLPRLREVRSLPHDVVTHLRLRFSHGPDAPKYNLLQRIVYASVLFVVLPVLILAGIEMSPGMDAALPWLRDALGGRQSARTIHFILAWALVLFVVVHVVMVVLSGLVNNMRSMITGRFTVKDVER